MFSAILIDDEKKAITVLEKMLTKYSDIDIVATATNPVDGINLIKQYEPDLLFLDIEMPGKTGFQVLEAISGIDCAVIFTTAYNEYAIKAIRFAALDYLLKPIEQEELDSALSRFRKLAKDRNQASQLNMLVDNLRNISDSFSKITISTIEGVNFVSVTEILYCEAEGGYTTLFLKSGEKIVSSKNIKEFEELLPVNNFFRIHHSYLINIQEIKRYMKGEGGTIVMSNQTEIPVSRRKKEEFQKKLKL